VLRFVKVHHNNNPGDTTNNSIGVQHGWTAESDLVEFVEIYRNGQDAMRVQGDSFTLRHSYIHDHYCNHPDGIQALVYTANSDVPDSEGRIADLSVLGNVFERVGLQQVFLGENVGHNSWVDGALIRDNLFLAGNYIIKTKNGRSTGFVIERNTFAGSSQFALEWCCASPGAVAPMVIRDNIFTGVRNPSGTAFYLNTGGGATTFADNCVWNSGAISGQVVQSGTIRENPQFQAGRWLPAAGSPCDGKGSSLGRALDLLALGTGQDQPATPTATGSPLPTWTNEPTATLTASATPTVTPMVTGTAPASPTAGPETLTATPTGTAANCLRLSDGLLCLIPFTPTP
jgi:hypothetical protein